MESLLDIDLLSRERDAHTDTATTVLDRVMVQARALKQALATHRRRHGVDVEVDGPNGWATLAPAVTMLRADVDRARAALR